MHRNNSHHGGGLTQREVLIEHARDHHVVRVGRHVKEQKAAIVGLVGVPSLATVSGLQDLGTVSVGIRRAAMKGMVRGERII